MAPRAQRMLDAFSGFTVPTSRAYRRGTPIQSPSFLLLEGEIEATFRGEKSVVRAGETLSIPANAPHSFTDASGQTVRLLCICAPAGQEEFFARVGVPVATRTTPPPKPDKATQAEFMKKAQELAPMYRTELLKPAR